MVNKQNSNNVFQQALDLKNALDKEKREEEKKIKEKEYYNNLSPEELWKRDLRDIKNLLEEIHSLVNIKTKYM